jgi:hypothetical protein
MAPLMLEGQWASFIGGVDVCDYLDFIVNPSKAADFFDLLIDYLRQQGKSELVLGPLRPDSTVLSCLVEIAEGRGCNISVSGHDVSLEMELPATWDEYLGLLCKILSMKDAIEKGLKNYDFLKRGETYKYRLGGIEINYK